MHEHHRLAAIQLSIEFEFFRVTEIAVACVALQIDAVELERVERVFDAAAGRLDIRQSDEAHGAEFSGMIGHGLRHVFVADLDQPFGEFDIAKVGAGRGDRQ